MTWDMGRLARYGDVTYKYGTSGIRLEKKSANGTVHKYFTHNGKILAEEIGSDMQIAYLYAGDSPDSMCVSQTQGFAVYNLVKDMLGNVVALIDDKGNRLASYEYDAWGNVSTYDGEGNRLDYAANSSHIAFINPFRYRGYYYDDETGLYYLQTRYYDPETRRFISPDTYDYLAPTSTHGLNLYLYCGNDPVNYYDPTGYFWLGALIGAIVGFIATAAVDLLDDGELFNGSVSAEAYVANTVVGAVAGATMGAVAPMSFTASIPTITATGTGALAVATATVTVTGTQVATAIGATVATAGLVLMAKPDSGPIKFKDGTGIDPDTGKMVETKKRAEEIIKKITDPKKRANWKKWMKGKGWRRSHLRR